jgi:hypothetical protein
MEGPGACGTPGPSKPFPGIGSPPGPTGHVQGLTPAAAPSDDQMRPMLWNARWPLPARSARRSTITARSEHVWGQTRDVGDFAGSSPAGHGSVTHGRDGRF